MLKLRNYFKLKVGTQLWYLTINSNKIFSTNKIK